MFALLLTIAVSVLTSASRENLSSGFPTSSDTNRAVQPHKVARGLKFRMIVLSM